MCNLSLRGQLLGLILNVYLIVPYYIYLVLQEKQFTIILELLGDNKLKSLTAAERRSLAFLKDSKGR